MSYFLKLQCNIREKTNCSRQNVRCVLTEGEREFCGEICGSESRERLVAQSPPSKTAPSLVQVSESGPHYSGNHAS